jgi:hypothetical protein
MTPFTVGLFDKGLFKTPFGVSSGLQTFTGPGDAASVYVDGVEIPTFTSAPIVSILIFPAPPIPDWTLVLFINGFSSGLVGGISGAGDGGCSIYSDAPSSVVDNSVALTDATFANPMGSGWNSFIVSATASSILARQNAVGPIANFPVQSARALSAAIDITINPLGGAMMFYERALALGEINYLLSKTVYP